MTIRQRYRSGMPKSMAYVTAVVLLAFGLLTLFLSSSILFDLFGIREREGNYVVLVVAANFVCSILYLFAAYGFVASKRWTFHLMVASAIILIVSYIGFIIIVSMGGLHEKKTFAALAFRITVTLVFAAIAYYSVYRGKRDG